MVLHRSHRCSKLFHMRSERRFIAKPALREELSEQERSGAWLSRKIKVSQQLMSFVLRNERTLGESKAVLAAAVLGGKDVELFFEPVATRVPKIATHETHETQEAA